MATVKGWTKPDKIPFLCRIGIHASICHQGGYRSFDFCNYCLTEVSR